MIANSGNRFTLGHTTEVSTTKSRKRIMKKCHPPSGQTCRVLSHLLMQWKWKAWLQTPGQHSHKHYRHNIAEQWRKKNVNSLQVMHPTFNKVTLILYKTEKEGIPHATVHSSLVALAWFAWHSIPGENKCKKQRHNYQFISLSDCFPHGN
jgi:hypothetical protein